MAHADTCTCDGCTDEAPTCYCPLTGVVNTLSKKYAMQIVSVVGAHGSLRFRDLESHLGDASTSTLSNRLEELAEAGLLTRTQYDEVPPRVEYALTDDGHELRERLEPLLEWASNRS